MPDRLTNLYAVSPVAKSLVASGSSGADLLRAALFLVNTRKLDYARASAPRSPNPEITGNHRPGETRLKWLQGQPKCNQFIGDVFSLAGRDFPTVRMQDNSLHYVHAERLLQEDRYFQKIPRKEIAIGDLHVLDYPHRSGPGGGAHVEMVIGVQGGKVQLLGAGEKGIYMVGKELRALPEYSHFLRGRG